jgi:hypothetical protein
MLLLGPKGVAPFPGCNAQYRFDLVPTREARFDVKCKSPKGAVNCFPSVEIAGGTNHHQK